MNNENYSRANRYFTSKGTLQMEMLVKELAAIMKLDNPRIEASTCRGKWRGTLDYSLVFDKGSLYLRNISSKKNKGEVTTKIIESLLANIAEYKNVFRLRHEIWDALKERERKDNERALSMGLQPYALKRIGLANTEDHCGWFYLVIDINGKERLHLETGLCHDIAKCRIDELRKIKENYYTAGGLNYSDVDFIECGVGFKSDTSMYSLSCEGVTVISELEADNRNNSNVA